jgi:hypothetical protein
MGDYFTLIQGFRVGRGDKVQVRFGDDGQWRWKTFDISKREVVNGKRQRVVYVQGIGGTGPDTFIGPYPMTHVRICDDLTAIAAKL